ncbi:MAG: alpha/beta hydrolase [Acidimicrobiia bacterium]
MDQPFHTVLDVPVAGGTLAVGVSGPASGAPVILAVHGITGSHRSWSPVARHLGDDFTFLAPDLRGRGASGDLPGPYGLDAHLDDLAAVLDHVGATSTSGTPRTPGVILAGHSMGAFVVARLAAAHPARFRAVALVDGGLVLPVPPDIDPQQVLAMVLGPALARLRMTFENHEAYREFWRAHPAFAGPGVWNADTEDYVDYDLTGEPGQMRSRVSEEAVQADGADVLDVDAVRRAFLALACPTVVVRAPRGLQDEPSPLLPETVVAQAKEALPHLVDVVVPDTNHYLILLGDREAKTVADQLRALSDA